MRVLRIHPQDTYPIRKIVLGLSDQSSTGYQYEDDCDDLTFHLGGFVGDNLVTVGSFYFKKHRAIGPAYQYELRDLMTLPEYRRNGHALMLLQTSFPMIIQNQSTYLWLYTPDYLIPFYENLDFIQVANESRLNAQGTTTFLMYKNLKN